MVQPKIDRRHLKETSFGVHYTVVAGERDNTCAAEDMSGYTANSRKRKVEEGVDERVLNHIRNIEVMIEDQRRTKPSLLDNLLTPLSSRSRPVVKNFGEKDVKMTAPSAPCPTADSCAVISLHLPRNDRAN